MKPSVTIDERGVVLHVTNDAGDGVAVPLSGETIREIVVAAGRLKARMLEPAQRIETFKKFGALLLELTK